jgi:hypothetical protein
MKRRLALLLVTLFALFLPVTSLAQSSKPVAAVVSKAHPAGDALFVEWGGSWWKATSIAPLGDGRTVIHYVGWGEDYDEVAKPKRIRTEIQNKAIFALNESVFVEWKGSWWPAKITKHNIGSYRIHYDGYGPEWDEDVPGSRVVRLSPPEG